MKMAQNAVKKPQWTLGLGKSVMAYLKHSLDFGLHYTKDVPEDSGPDLRRSQPRHWGTLEVLVDASFSPGDSHSVSGTIIMLAGCLVQWESKKQSLMALSTAEAELTAIVEGLQAGRSVRALIELLVPKVESEIYNDNRAAVVLASGAGGGWRTRQNAPSQNQGELPVRSIESRGVDTEPPHGFLAVGGWTNKTSSSTAFEPFL